MNLFLLTYIELFNPTFNKTTQHNYLHFVAVLRMPLRLYTLKHSVTCVTMQPGITIPTIQIVPTLLCPQY